MSQGVDEMILASAIGMAQFPLLPWGREMVLLGQAMIGTSLLTSGALMALLLMRPVGGSYQALRIGERTTGIALVAAFGLIGLSLAFGAWTGWSGRS